MTLLFPLVRCILSQTYTNGHTIAHTNTDDYTATIRTLTFQPGVISISVDVPIIDDEIFEPLEYFYAHLVLRDPMQSSFVTITESTARIQIISDNRKSFANG